MLEPVRKDLRDTLPRNSALPPDLLHIARSGSSHRGLGRAADCGRQRGLEELLCCLARPIERAHVVLRLPSRPLYEKKRKRTCPKRPSNYSFQKRVYAYNSHPTISCLANWPGRRQTDLAQSGLCRQIFFARHSRCKGGENGPASTGRNGRPRGGLLNSGILMRARRRNSFLYRRFGPAG